MSDSLWSHELQHTRLPCPSLSPGVGSNSCPLSRWCHSTILSFVSPFSSCPQSFPASGSFPKSQFFSSGGQSFISPSDEYSELISFRIDWFDLLAVEGTLKSLLQAPQFESISSLAPSLLTVQLSHLYITTEKTISLTIWTFVSKVMSLLFNMLSRFVIAFLSRSKWKMSNLQIGKYVRFEMVVTW